MRRARSSTRYGFGNTSIEPSSTPRLSDAAFAESRGHQHLQRRPMFAQFLYELRAEQAARQHDVRKDEGDFGCCMNCSSACRPFDASSTRYPSERRISTAVMRTSTLSSTTSSVSTPRGRSAAADAVRQADALDARMRSRKVQVHGRALADVARDARVAARLTHETVHHGQTEAAALADFLGGEERLERALHDVGRHARPVSATSSTAYSPRRYRLFTRLPLDRSSRCASGS